MSLREPSNTCSGSSNRRMGRHLGRHPEIAGSREQAMTTRNCRPHRQQPPLDLPCVYVETPRERPGHMSPHDADALQQNIRLAENLGARVPLECPLDWA
jgi:hypothetical protein